MKILNQLIYFYKKEQKKEKKISNLNKQLNILYTQTLNDNRKNYIKNTYH